HVERNVANAGIPLQPECEIVHHRRTDQGCSQEASEKEEPIVPNTTNWDVSSFPFHNMKPSILKLLFACGIVLFAMVAESSAQTASRALMTLLKSGKVPAARMPVIIDLICQRGEPDDLAYIFQRVMTPDGFPADVRTKALEELADAMSTRKVKPSGDLTKI